MNRLTALSGESLLVLLAVLGVTLALFYLFVYRREQKQNRALTTSQTFLLWALRGIAGLLALLALARPAVTFTQREEHLPTVAMLVDESASMAFPGERNDPFVAEDSRDKRSRYDSAIAAATRLQESLTTTHRVRIYGFSDALRLIREFPLRKPQEPALSRDEVFAPGFKPEGEYSNVGDAIQDAMRELSSDKISGLIVLSDFRRTGGVELEKVADFARKAGVSIHSIVQGTEFPLRDLRIDEIITGPEASLGDVLTFHLKIVNQIQEGLEPKVTILEEGKQISARKTRLKRGENVVAVSVIPETEGLREFSVELEPQEDEADLENNKSSVRVKVVKKSLRVLLIADKPTTEYFYMTPALLRDPVISLSCFLQSSDIDYVHQGNVNVERLPRTLKEWQLFDVAILYDVDPNGITDRQISALESMIQKGGGLLIVAGRNNGLAKLLQVHATRMRSLLPVEIDKNDFPDLEKCFDKPLEARRTPQGKNHPILLSSSSMEINEKVWESFPSLYWSHPVTDIKPQAVGLMEKSESGGSAGSKCLMALQRYGEGAVFFSATDTLWRWRNAAESYDYDKFWTRVIRYLGETRMQGSQKLVALGTDRQLYSPGEQVKVSLRILDQALMSQMGGKPVYASVTSPNKDKRMIELRPRSDQTPIYDGVYDARAVGSMILGARQTAPDADSDQKPLFDVQGAFEVRMQSLESKDTSADLDGATRMPEKTGGVCLSYKTMKSRDSLQDVLRAIPTEPQVLERAIRMEVWDGVFFLVLFLSLISTEWCLRKLWGLL